MLIATLTASLVTNSGRSAWFVEVLVLMVYLIFAMTRTSCRPGPRYPEVLKCTDAFHRYLPPDPKHPERPGLRGTGGDPRPGGSAGDTDRFG